MKSPCARDCPDRSPTCHGECQKYLDFYNQRREEVKQRIIKYKAVDYHADNVLKCRKKKGLKTGKTGGYLKR